MRVFLCPTEAEWTEWFDRDDERGSGDWEKLSELREAYPDRLCGSPLDIQVQKHCSPPLSFRPASAHYSALKSITSSYLQTKPMSTH